MNWNLASRILFVRNAEAELTSRTQIVQSNRGLFTHQWNNVHIYNDGKGWGTRILLRLYLLTPTLWPHLLTLIQVGSREHGKSKWRDRETGVNTAKGEAQEIHRYRARHTNTGGLTLQRGTVLQPGLKSHSASSTADEMQVGVWAEVRNHRNTVAALVIVERIALQGGHRWPLTLFRSNSVFQTKS